MISQSVEYALRAVVTIAQHAGRPCTVQQIATIARIPAPYLSKLMRGLVRMKLVRSQRGVHGGFVLVKPASELTIWDVVDAVEPFQRIRSCPLGIQSHALTLCPLHRRLDAAMASVEEQFRSTTVADILADPFGTSPLCQEHRLFTLATDAPAVSKPATSPKPKSRPRNRNPNRPPK